MVGSRNRFRTHTAGEIGWISTADVFIFGTCFLLVMVGFTLKSLRRTQVQLAASKTQLTQIRESLSDEANARSQLEAEVEVLHSSNAQASLEIAERDAELVDMAGKMQHAIKRERAAVLEHNRLATELERIKNDHQKALNQARMEFVARIEEFKKAQRRRNNQIVGLGGQLRRVAFLVDVSSSMRGQKNSWDLTLERINTWVNNLDVEEATLIIFGDEARTIYPLTLMTDESRKSLIKKLESLEPNDQSTDLLDAFRRAYELENLDTIVVFSDGLPTIDVNGKKIEIRERAVGESDVEYQARKEREIRVNRDRILAVKEKISQMASERPQIAINAIGLGELVFSEHVGNLLNDLALKHGGIFVAMQPE